LAAGAGSVWAAAGKDTVPTSPAVSRNREMVRTFNSAAVQRSPIAAGVPVGGEAGLRACERVSV
jgi:hypothetical protein